jgi:hypothetical protein
MIIAHTTLGTTRDTIQFADWKKVVTWLSRVTGKNLRYVPSLGGIRVTMSSHVLSIRFSEENKPITGIRVARWAMRARLIRNEE